LAALPPEDARTSGGSANGAGAQGRRQPPWAPQNGPLAYEVFVERELLPDRAGCEHIVQLCQPQDATAAPAAATSAWEEASADNSEFPELRAAAPKVLSKKVCQNVVAWLPIDADASADAVSEGSVSSGIPRRCIAVCNSTEAAEKLFGEALDCGWAAGRLGEAPRRRGGAPGFSSRRAWGSSSPA